MAKKSEHWASAAQVDLVPLEPERLHMFRSTVSSDGADWDRYASA